MSTTDAHPIIGVFLGDASGCGPELVAKLAATGRLTRDCRPVIIGDARVFEAAQRYAGVTVPTFIIGSMTEANWDGDAIPFYDMENLDPASFTMGAVSAECGRASGEGLTLAIKLCMAEEIDGILYAPIHKQALYLGGFTHGSEVGIFTSLIKGVGYQGEINILGNLWTTRVTSHIPLKDVSANLTKEKIVTAIEFGDSALRQAGYEHPRLGVAALNPHAGENGKCGSEEIDIILPAVEQAAASGIDVTGPFSADTVFDRAFNGEFDMVVTLYHDQGQIALKTKGFREGVTVAGGFPIPIVTPAHGTAFATAGKGTADDTAIERALAVCHRMSVQRRAERVTA